MNLKPINIILIILIFIVAGVYFGIFSNNSDIKKISAEDAKNNMENNSDIILLDVRTEEENKEIRIPGSTLIPLDKLESNVEIVIPDKEKTIYVYCRSGNRSVSAVKILLKLGYKNVYDLGGINQWPYETISN
jgi:rhodanese-related sulfurtransferase